MISSRCFLVEVRCGPTSVPNHALRGVARQGASGAAGARPVRAPVRPERRGIGPQRAHGGRGDDHALERLRTREIRAAAGLSRPSPCRAADSRGYGEHRKSKSRLFDYTTCQNIYQRCRNRPRSRPEPNGVPRYECTKMKKTCASIRPTDRARVAPALLATHPAGRERRHPCV